jgi:hypothetical protein
MEPNEDENAASIGSGLTDGNTGTFGWRDMFVHPDDDPRSNYPTGEHRTGRAPSTTCMPSD